MRKKSGHVIEVNPRASRTVPFVSKAIGVPLAKLAAKIMVGEKLPDLGLTQRIIPSHYNVKEAVFPWPRFPGIDIVLGPEMKSTGEVMGIDEDLGMAYAKSQMSGFNPLPMEGNVFISWSSTRASVRATWRASSSRSSARPTRTPSATARFSRTRCGLARSSLWSIRQAATNRGRMKGSSEVPR